MNKSYEKIQALQQKTGATFEQADRALARARGNEDQAAYDLLRRIARKKKGDRVGPDIWDRIAGIFLYALRIDREEKIYVNIPVWVIYILLLVFAIAAGGRYSNGTGSFIFGTVVIYLCIVLSRCRVHLVPPSHREVKLEAVDTGGLPAEEALARYAEDPVAESGDGEHTIVIE